MGRLLHDITQLSCKGQVSLSLHDRGLYIDNVAPCLCPCKPSCNTDLVSFLFTLWKILWGSKVFMQVVRGYPVSPGLSFCSKFCHLAQYIGNFPFQIPDTRLSCILCDNPLQRTIRNQGIFSFNPMFFELTRNKIIYRYAYLFFFCI